MWASRSHIFLNNCHGCQTFLAEKRVDYFYFYFQIKYLYFPFSSTVRIYFIGMIVRATKNSYTPTIQQVIAIRNPMSSELIMPKSKKKVGCQFLNFHMAHINWKLKKWPLLLVNCFANKIIARTLKILRIKSLKLLSPIMVVLFLYTLLCYYNKLLTSL